MITSISQFKPIFAVYVNSLNFPFRYLFSCNWNNLLEAYKIEMNTKFGYAVQKFFTSVGLVQRIICYNFTCERGNLSSTHSKNCNLTPSFQSRSLSHYVFSLESRVDKTGSSPKSRPCRFELVTIWIWKSSSL